MTLHKPLLLLACFLILLCTRSVAAQTRSSERNDIQWFAFNGTFNISSRFGIHTEYQWRREEFIKNWQQGLLRIGFNYNVHPDVQFRAGYAWIESFPYGEVPLNGMGKDFTEHRAFEMVTIRDKVSLLNLSHRFMLEQRWVGRYSDDSLTKEDQFPLLHRLRYMARVQIPLNRKAIADNTLYGVFYDEVFIGFGKNVGENIFDQNRLGLLLGYRFTKDLQIEGGYLNQLVQLGREIDGKNHFQYNQGFILSLNLSADLYKQKDGGKQ